MQWCRIYRAYPTCLRHLRGSASLLGASEALPYSALCHLFWTVCPSRDPERSHFAFMSAHREYAAFFVASGKPWPGLVLFVSGFVSTRPKWEEFDGAWHRLMKRWGITQESFHAYKYAMGSGPDYPRFRNTDAERIAFEGEATTIIKASTNTPFSFGMSVDDFNKAHEEYAFSPGLDRPYSLAGCGVIGQIGMWVKRRRAEGRFDAIRIVFEDGDDDRGVIADAIKRETGERLLLGTKEEWSPLVLGDILAWRHARLVKRGSLREKGHACWSGLFKHLPHHSCVYLATSNVMEMAQKLGTPRT
jgi:hypothetical protein